MRLKFLAILGLIVLCSSSLALKMNEEIEVEGYGLLSAQTEQISVYDRLFGYGEDQAYSRKLTSGDYEQASLETAYTYRNSKSIEGINVSGRYEAGLRVPDGVRHTIWVKSNDSIDTASAMSYECGDLIIGKSYFDWKARNANLSERLSGMGGDTMASTDIQGNFSLFNELEENQRVYCTVGVLKEMLEAVEMRGSNQVQEVRVKGPKTIIMEGKSAPADVQASYLQRDAEQLIRDAFTEKNETNRRQALNGALTYIDEALKIYPNDAIGYHNKGSALYLLNRTSEAIDALRESVRLDPNDPKTIFGLAYILFNSSRYEDSIVYFNMGLEKDPARDGGVPWRDLTIAYNRLGNLGMAEYAINKYINLTIPDSMTYFQKAEIQEKRQNYQGAAESYENGLALVNQNEKEKNGKFYATQYIFLGDAYFDVGDMWKAKEDITKAKESYERAKGNYGRAETLYPDYADTVDASIKAVEQEIQSLGQDSAGLPPAETPPTASPANSTVSSNTSEPANGL